MANKLEVRIVNRQLVYQAVYMHDDMSKQEISIATGLSIPTVAQNLKELAAMKLVETAGEFESTGGRKATKISCVYDTKYSVGIDITANHLTIVVIDLSTEVVIGIIRQQKKYVDSDRYYDYIVKELNEALTEKKIKKESILGVGISLPCIVDRKTNTVTYSRVIDAPSNIRDYFKSRLSMDVEIFNDANSAANAEVWRAGDTQGLFYIMLSNSVGGAFIYDGTAYLGDNCRSCEVGHMRIVPKGKKCFCGERGCSNAYCSALVLADRCDGNLETFFDQLKNGSKECAKVFEEYLDYLAVTVMNVRHLYDCDVILGGYVGAYMSDYMDRLRMKVTDINPYEENSDFLRPCKYKKEASAVGSALVFIQDFMKNI